MKSPLSTLISQKHIQPTFVTDSHLSKFSNYYRRSPFFSSFFPILSSFYNDSFSSPLFLSDFNIALFFSSGNLYRFKSIDTKTIFPFIPLFRTSPVTLKLISSFIFVRSLMLLHICLPSVQKTYMAPELHKFSQNRLEIKWQQFNHVCYKDDIKFYQPYLSIVDFLFHNAPSRLADYLDTCGSWVSN